MLVAMTTKLLIRARFTLVYLVFFVIGLNLSGLILFSLLASSTMFPSEWDCHGFARDVHLLEDRRG